MVLATLVNGEIGIAILLFVGVDGHGRHGNGHIAGNVGRSKLVAGQGLAADKDLDATRFQFVNQSRLGFFFAAVCFA